MSDVIGYLGCVYCMFSFYLLRTALHMKYFGTKSEILPALCLPLLQMAGLSTPLYINLLSLLVT
jgi:hypothetical protein